MTGTAFADSYTETPVGARGANPRAGDATDTGPLFAAVNVDVASPCDWLLPIFCEVNSGILLSGVAVRPFRTFHRLRLHSFSLIKTRFKS